MSDNTPNDDQAGLAERAKDMLGRVSKNDATDAVSDAGAAGAGAAAGVAGAAGGLMGKFKDKAAGAADSAKDAAGSAKDTAGGITGKAAGVAGAAGAAVTGAAGTAKDTVAGVVDAGADVIETDNVKAGAAVAGGAGAAGGAAGGGGAGGSGGGDDDDDEKLFAESSISGSKQIMGLGLLVAAFMLFGGTILGWFGADEAVTDLTTAGAEVETPAECIPVIDALRDSDDYDNGISCTVEDGEVVLKGKVGTAAAVSALGALAIDGTDFDVINKLTVADADVEEVVTTDAPATTVVATTAAPETTEAETTAAPETTEAAAYTMWNALNDSGEATQFATIGAALGLQAALDDPSINSTLFAPSDAALAAMGSDGLGALIADPEAATALTGYHFVDERLTEADLTGRAGGDLASRTGVPIAVSLDGDSLVLNGTSRIVSTDHIADNGIVHIIDVVLDPAAGAPAPAATEPCLNLAIEFAVASATITADGQAELQSAVDFFTADAEATAAINGHTDSDGSDELNNDLSARRAQAVLDYLVAQGLDASRFTSEGFGETQLILEDGVENKALSRRIEFICN